MVVSNNRKSEAAQLKKLFKSCLPLQIAKPAHIIDTANTHNSQKLTGDKPMAALGQKTPVTV